MNRKGRERWGGGGAVVRGTVGGRGTRWDQKQIRLLKYLLTAVKKSTM